MRQGQKWFDCAECHHEQEDHDLLQKLDMVDSLLTWIRYGLVSDFNRRHLHARNVGNVSEKTLRNSRRGILHLRTPDGGLILKSLE